MRGRTLYTIASIVAVALVATVTVAFTASGVPAGHERGLIGHLHELAQQLHGGGAHGDPMTQLIEQLDLRPDQLRRVERISELVGTQPSGAHQSMQELHEQLITRLGRGQVGTDAIRQIVDRHFTEPAVASALTDELVALANGLDDAQREMLLEHLPRAGGH